MRNFKGHAFLFIILTSLLSGCELLSWKDKFLGAVVEMIPMEFEVAMGDRLLPSIFPESQKIGDQALLNDLKGLLKPLSSQVSQPPLKIHISKSPDLNAFATPGGHLVFNKGLLLAAESPEEILGVASHEIAHATERHTMRSMVQGLGIYALITIFLGDVSGLGAILIDQGRVLLQNGFSREQERAADAIGVKSLISANIHPQGMMQFFQKLEKQNEAQKQAGIEIPPFMSTHPLTTDRIEAIEMELKKIPEKKKANWKPVAFDLKSFQARLAKTN